MNCESAGYILAYKSIQLLEINVYFSKTVTIYTASDINSNYIRNNIISHRHSKANYCTNTYMCIRHDYNHAIGESRMI